MAQRQRRITPHSRYSTKNAIWCGFSAIAPAGGKPLVIRPAGFLADYLTYKSVDYRAGKLYVWVDTSGLHTDHMVRTTLNETMEIECCEML